MIRGEMYRAPGKCVIEPLEGRLLLNGDVDRILFIRGGTGTGGFLEGGSLEVRDEQLADINNTSTANGNHGWGTLANLLRAEGYEVEQVTEGPAGSNTPVNLAGMDLSQYKVIVFGSNNADYLPFGDTAHVDAVEQFVRDGGGVLFISDANFGSDWRDAADSDQQFLDRFGLTMNQDHGTYAVTRGAGDFVVSDHPIFQGVNSFDGEGVSPIRLSATAPPGVTRTILAKAKGQTRDNNGTNPVQQYIGTTRNVDSLDGALVIAEAGQGRVAGHFDRNTFFNANGAGTDITRHDNQQYALNLFNWVSGRTDPQPERGFIWGYVYRDTNGNGNKQREEPVLEGRVVYLDLNKSGFHDVGEPYAVTDANGFWRFDDLPPGQYRVRQSVPKGWRQTDPNFGWGHVLTLNAGQEIGKRLFGQTRKVLIAGQVINSQTGQGMAGWRVFIDYNNNGAFNAHEPGVRTDEEGHWLFHSLGEGDYVLRLVQVGGFEPTSAMSFTVSLGAGQTSTGHVFSQRPIA